MLNPTDFPTHVSIRTRWHEEEQQTRTFLATLDDETIQRTVCYTNTHGQTFQTPLWQLMVHVVNHGTQHRSEATAMLTSLVHSPSDLDFLIFVLGRE